MSAGLGLDGVVSRIGVRKGMSEMADRQERWREEHRSHEPSSGLNGVEACLTLSEQYGDLFWGRKLIER